MSRDDRRVRPEETEASRLAEVDGGRGVAALFPIRVVSRLTGINPVTIRAWERRYRLIRPERTPGGHRLYSRADVELLRAASRLIDQGVSISRATRLLDAPRQEERDVGEEHALGMFLDRLRALDEDGMNAVFESVLARRDHGGAAALLDQLPGVAAGLPRLERQVLDNWLTGLLAFRVYQRSAQPGEPRVLVCNPGGDTQRIWALVFALGLVGSGLRPMLLASPEPVGLDVAVARSGCAAVVLGGTGADWPGMDGSVLPVPLFLDGANSGSLALGDDLPRARSRVVAQLTGNAQ